MPAQGDVLALYDNDLNIVAEYTYDSWGKLLSVTGSLASTVGQTNPFRYRGYYYDSETELYYLNSRYYDPEIGRFINADGYVSTEQGVLGNNMFAYCGNNPVVRVDSTGNFWGAVLVALAIVAVAFKITRAIVKQRNYTRNRTADSNPESSTANKIVNDQNKKTGKSFRYGLYKAKKNSCEAIAVHNAKVLKKRNSSLSQTIKDFQDNNAMIGLGYFGSNPYAIGKVLKSEGVDYSRVSLSEMKKAGTYIISFWNDNVPWGGLHTVAVSYDGSAYNLYCDGSEYTIDLESYNSRFICGYYIGEFYEKN